MAESDEFAGFRPIVVGNRFGCPWEKWEAPSAGDFMKYVCFTKNNNNVPKDKETLDAILPIIPIDRGKLQKPLDNQVHVMWIGHATVLVLFDGITILTDPVCYDSRKRYRPPSCNIDDIPSLDAVIISHDHFDHLDELSVKSLHRRFPDLQWYTGKGFAALFAKFGCSGINVHEMTWWETSRMALKNQSNTFEFICTPAQHWCRRGLFDENKRLWCGWVVKGPNKNFFFAGDTGYYAPLFKKIGDKYGPFDLAAIPIGAYEPREFLKYQHIDPGEAVQVHEDIKAKCSLGIHWGTCSMGKEWYLEPAQKLKQEMDNRNLDPEKFQCLNQGEIWEVGTKRPESNFMSVVNPSLTLK